MAFDLHPSRWAAIVAAFALFFIVLSGTVRYTNGDSRYSLLATQALLEHGSLRLDPYSKRFSLHQLNHDHLWMVYFDKATGHAYYDYPVGTPIFSIPFVAVARAVGLQPINQYDDNDLQMLIASTLIVIIFLLMFRLALLYLSDWGALTFAALFTIGSSLTSTLGTALWSQNFQVIFICLALLELAMVSRGKRETVRGGWLGAWLFAAYLCRPTTAPFILIIFGYLAWRQRKALPWAVGVAGGLLLLFIIWSKIEMGRWLPRYYSPDNWEPYGDYMHNLWPILFGPARGLFSFTPVLCLMFVGFASAKLRKEPLFWAMWAWLALLTVVILRSKTPWGGWCYGPRFYSEILPGLGWVLLMVLEASEAWAINWRKTIGISFLVTSLMGAYIHTWQGLYSQPTSNWNGTPNIDGFWPLRRWDWRYPQFMATNKQISTHQRESEVSGLVLEAMGPVPVGGALLFGMPDPELQDFFEYWNRKDLLHTGKLVYNTVLDVSEAGHTEFWYVAELEALLHDRKDVLITPPPADSVLGADSVMIAVPGPKLGHGRILSPTEPK